MKTVKVGRTLEKVVERGDYPPARVRRILKDETVAAVVMSPPYNVGVAYDEHDDTMAWPAYWCAMSTVVEELDRVMESSARAWTNVAPVVQQQPGGAGRNGGPHSGRARKDRESLVYGWSFLYEEQGHKPCDVIAWCSQRGSGTAWGSWQSPSAPNVRGDWEAVLVHYKDSWPRVAPAGLEYACEPDAV